MQHCCTYNLTVLRNAVIYTVMKQLEWTLKTLCIEAEVSPRTVRYYIQQGLLPPPDRAGPRAKYSQGHVSRLRLIRRLKEEHLPLAEIRSRISTLSDGDVAQMLATSPVPSSQSAADYVRAVLGGTRFADSSQSQPPPSYSRVSHSQSVGPRLSSSSPGRDLSPSSQTPRRSNWERHSLTEDIELHIRRPLSRSQDKQVRMLLGLARKLLSKDSE